MRILHTADWHLCTKLGRIDRTDDLKRRVERVAALCREHEVDVLLIAGDLFCDRAEPKPMTDAFGHIHKTFADYFQRNGTILAITGNHDRDLRINMTRAGMTLASPVVGQDGNLVNGRMYLINGLSFVALNSTRGQRVQFALVPYPFPSRYDLPDNYRTKEEVTQLLRQKVAEWIQSVSGRPTFDPALPTVLTAHLHVRGAEAHSLYQLTERDDVLFNFADLNPGWAYVALGHIHKPQSVGADNVRYPGSLDRLDFGETHDDHGVLLLDIDGASTVKPLRIPIPATPFYKIELTDPEVELPGLAEKFPDRETAIVKVTVAPTANGPSRDEVSRELRKIFPRLHELTWLGTTDDAEDAKPTFKPQASFAATVRDFLTERLTDDPDKDAVLELAESFLRAEGDS